MASAIDINTEEQELDRLLTEKYNYLVRHISPREFIPHLISKNVLTTEDKEEVESKVTSVDRAGRLIDLVKMRGFKGMREFMLVLEYDVPAAFFHVKKHEAREPPTDWLEMRRTLPSVRKRRSRESMSAITGLISHLMTEMTQQRSAVDHIMKKMKDVEVLQTETKEEQEKGWKDYEREITELEDRCATLSNDLVQSKRENEELRTRNETLREENQKYVLLHQEGRARLTDFQTKYDQMHSELEAYKSRKSLFRPRDTTSVDALQGEIERLTNLLQSSSPAEDEDKMKRLERHVNELSQRNAEFNADMVTAQEERDKTLRELERTEKQLGETKAQLSQLEEEVATSNKRADDYAKKCGKLEDEMYWSYRKSVKRVNSNSSPVLNPQKSIEAINRQFEPYGTG